MQQGEEQLVGSALGQRCTVCLEGSVQTSDPGNGSGREHCYSTMNSLIFAVIKNKQFSQKSGNPGVCDYEQPSVRKNVT